MEKSNVINMLKHGWVNIEFEKKDGTIRQMVASLNEKDLPTQIDVEEAIQKKTPNPDVLAVFDVVNNGWRSFRWNSLKLVNGVECGQLED